MSKRPKKIRRLLVANRSEIAIRVLRAANELGIDTVAIFANEDRFALHIAKADESYQVGAGKGPIEAYLDIEDIIRIAKRAKVDAIHPGYGFLAENPDFADACIEAGITFIGPSPDVMRSLGNKVSARKLAVASGAPVMPASGPLPSDEKSIHTAAEKVGFPVMLKASWGGGGRGMRVIETADELIDQVMAGRREAMSAFGNDEVYLEKLVRHARHVEVQILGDTHGNLYHLFERDCSVQRRNQKVVERAPAPYLDDSQRKVLTDAALAIGNTAGYANAGTVEFLMDVDTGEFYFIEVNPRIQVEHTVTETVTGIDIVKAQIRIAEGATVGTDESGVPKQEDIKLNGHAIQCRVTTEDPENNFVPDYGRITTYRGATGFGIRLDGGTAYSGALITRHFDSLLEKVTAWAPTPEEAILRMDRALREFRIRGVATNLLFLETLITHPKFRDNDYTTRFIDETPELFHFVKRRDRATRLLNYIGDVIVNGNPEVEGRPRPTSFTTLKSIPVDPGSPPDGNLQRLEELGPTGFAQWMMEQKNLLITDTTFRDAHQSLFATRMRTHDLIKPADAYAAMLPELLSVETWGGATFDVAMRFLNECPWERLARFKETMPNMIQQMLLRASNGVGYTNYPDNVVRYFVEQSADAGIDLFRIFDSLNWVDNMRPAMDTVLESGKLCEGSMCYTGDITDPSRAKYDLDYYLTLGKDLEAAGAHILGVKDMGGLMKPAAATILFKALKQEVGIPIHFHTHDTSGIAAASILAASEAGVDAVDAAMDSMSGLTSQPNLGSIAAALRGSERDTGLDQRALTVISDYWEQARRNYAGFEPDIRAGTSSVYQHEMPGGQYTNLRQQARSLGIEERWDDIARTYAQVNHMFGDVIKVTPTSKVVGDMALMMVTSGLTPDDVMSPDREIAFPESAVQLFGGEMGQAYGGFPEELQKKILKGRAPLTKRPGEVLPSTDLTKAHSDADGKVGRRISDQELASYLMYPDVFVDYAKVRRTYGNISVLPTPAFFYGMETNDEISVDLERGVSLVIRFLAVGDPNDQGRRNVFFELNGQPRTVRVIDRGRAPTEEEHAQAEDGNPDHVGAPMPGLIVSVSINEGDKVKRGDVLVAIEAMKMETSIFAERDGVIDKVLHHVGAQVDTKDLLVVMESE
ncbi:MAG: pyruvate carboxylase [Rhodospirillaceae bacterium]|nr:pyruvate carboxylase [Rhodospirillales bacterium]MBT3905685.1 pyruvate carboxylase [Rhodospirillaceae bacterium]MBT5034322.1 pyruvate carboxylase [Rhodospirillaceae bacterium]